MRAALHDRAALLSPGAEPCFCIYAAAVMQSSVAHRTALDRAYSLAMASFRTSLLSFDILLNLQAYKGLQLLKALLAGAHCEQGGCAAGGANCTSSHLLLSACCLRGERGRKEARRGPKARPAFLWCMVGWMSQTTSWAPAEAARPT